MDAPPDHDLAPADDPVLDPPLPALDLRRDTADPRVLVVRLDDPDRRNVMSTLMTASWRRLTDRLADGLRPGRDTGAGPPGPEAGSSRGEEVRAVVLTGAGGAFSSGGDLAWLDEGTGPGADPVALEARMAAYYDDWLSLRGLGIPVVAAVAGPAVGAGLGLALACDVRLVATSARLSVPFTALGLHPGMGTTWTLAQAVGPAVARELLLTGRAVGADEAVRLGLATSAHPDAELLDAALATARTLAARAPVATRLLLRSLADQPPDLQAALGREAAAQAATLVTEDLVEGLAAARGRRAPRFRGR